MFRIVGTAFLGYALCSYISTDLRQDSVPIKRTRSAKGDGADASGSVTAAQLIATLEFGSPGQEIDLVVDNESGDVSVYYGPTVNLTSYYNPQNSTTYEFTNAGFSTGAYIQDTIKFGDSHAQTQFGVQTYYQTGSLSPYGTLGLGPAFDEVGYSKYPGFLQTFKDVGIIESLSYSIYFGSDQASPAIVIGALDKSKYQGQLKQFSWADDQLPVADLSFDGFNGTLSSIGLSTSSSYTTADNGTIAPIAAKYGAVYDEYWEMYVSSSIPENADPLGLVLNGVSAQVPVESLFIKSDNGGYNFALQVLDEFSASTMGVPLLSAFYLVVDIDQQVGAVAEAVSQPRADDIVTISGSIPGAD